MFSDKKSSSLRPLVMFRVKIYFVYHFIISSIEEDGINIIFSTISSFSLKTSCSTQLENPLENLQNRNLKISNYLFESINDSISTNNWFLQFHQKSFTWLGEKRKDLALKAFGEGQKRFVIKGHIIHSCWTLQKLRIE